MFKRLRKFLASPKFQRPFNGWLVIFWILIIPITLFFGWQESVTFVSALSIWALVASHLTGWLTAKQDDDREE